MLAMSTRQRQVAFLSLGGAALLVLLVGILAVVIAVDAPAVWLGICLGVILLIIIAEIVLLLTERPTMHEEDAPHPVLGPAAPAQRPAQPPQTAAAPTQPRKDEDVEFEL